MGTNVKDHEQIIAAMSREQLERCMAEIVKIVSKPMSNNGEITSSMIAVEHVLLNHKLITYDG